MHSSTSPSITLTLDEKLARLRQPVRLTSDVLPRFVLIMLECALHSFLCSFAACVAELIERYRRGELELWPDEDLDAADAPRQSHHQLTLAPAARRRRAGAKHGPAVAATAVEQAAAGLVGCKAGGVWSIQLPARPLGGDAQGCVQSVVRPFWDSSWLRVDRCRSAMVFSAAETLWDNCVQIVPVSY